MGTLMEASFEGYYEVAKAFIRTRCDLTVENKKGRTAKKDAQIKKHFT
jgi:hypothetical protein